MLKALQPYLVCAWNGRRGDDAPPEAQEVIRQAPFQRGRSNIVVHILNSNGKLVHSFDGLTDRHGDMLDMKRRMPGFFLDQLDWAEARMKMPANVTAKKGLTLPTIEAAGDPAGVRVYLSFGENHLDHFLAPTVEAAALTAAEREATRYGAEPRVISASVFKGWLGQCYPPAVMDGMGGFRRIAGNLTWRPAGQDAAFRYAILTGTVSFEMDNQGHATYQGPLDVVLRYRGEKPELADFQGVLTTNVPKQNPQGHVVERIRMTVAIESLAGAKKGTAVSAR